MPVYKFTDEQAAQLKNMLWFEQKTHIGWPLLATMQMQEGQQNGQMASDRAPLPEGSGDQVGVHGGQSNNGQTNPAPVPGSDVPRPKRPESMDAQKRG